MDDPVEAQVDAYNARDLDRFVAAYADDVVIEDARGAVLMRGVAELRRVYDELFAASPELHAEILTRVRVGAYVVDEERVTGRSSGPDVQVVVVYHVDGGRIDHVRLIR